MMTCNTCIERCLIAPRRDDVTPQQHWGPQPSLMQCSAAAKGYVT